MKEQDKALQLWKARALAMNAEFDRLLPGWQSEAQRAQYATMTDIDFDVSGALALLRAGMLVQRRAWKEKGFHLILRKKGDLGWVGPTTIQRRCESVPDVQRWKPKHADILATDWRCLGRAPVGG
jgi:hypothetical protein